MTYSVKEIFKTLQGEGFHTGRAAVFCRFTGCNFWNGNDLDRIHSVCKFCDTDFLGINGFNGGKFKSASSLAREISRIWGGDNFGRYVVLTGGEPLLQTDSDLLSELHNNGFEVGIETNGSIMPPKGIDWICVSPKDLNRMILRKGNELKLVFPQDGICPNNFVNMDFQNFYLQPMYSDDLASNINLAVDYCKKNPKWRLSLQTHKYIGIP
ncbi:organic radical activating enzyme [Candidatus Kinetoplastibacterium oncopeltii TCC290E]|uniref:7-carboxy-7-deazaguanine synthase n=1 Tax=Candidatus Kinetoplastidibacterium stringomonadis TCC290E TaxID=1208920 RepID=M1L6S4_9PROT|nr:7-carboxy-7-deazaguanine synthase [Candidatus Kinetoplastibacterium oncopeltii]AGF48263.1 organic radical activating enzyme [Candidatus Kinetoplastibacterium oncopeltii TCC290E]